MSPDDPRHGSTAGRMRHWQDGEQPCESCTVAGRRQDKAARLDRARGRPRTVELGPVAWGVIHATPRDQLAAATGITVHKLSTLDSAGPTKPVRRATRDRILAASKQQFWTPIGMQRRLQALSALGWSMLEIAQRADVNVDGLKRLRSRHAPKFVRTVFAEAILAVYADLHMAPAPQGRSAAKTRWNARVNGYAPPFAWDDIDDADEAPNDLHDEVDPKDVDHAVVWRVLQGDVLPANTPERIEIMRRWVASGRSERSLCARMGWKEGRYTLSTNPQRDEDSLGSVGVPSDNFRDEREAS